MTPLLDALAQYVDVLSHASSATTRAEDRAAYQGHLAAAAEIFLCLHSGRVSAAKEIIHAQRRAYGLGYLSGDEGAAATAAFEQFAWTIEASHAA